MIHRLAVAAVPAFNPTPTTPPGLGKFDTVLNWLAWGVTFVAVIGFLVSLAMIVTGALRGQEMNGMKGLVLSLIVCVCVGGTGAIMGAVGAK